MSSLPGGYETRVAAHRVAAWVPPVARLGYAAKGVVYALVGWIALRAATGAGEADGSTGALASLAREEGGQAMLLVIALGLLGHVVWRLVQATLDPEHERRDAKRVGMRLFYLVSAAVYAALGWTAWRLSRGAGADAGDGEEIWIARLLAQPFGTWLVMLAGLGVVGYGCTSWSRPSRATSTGGWRVPTRPPAAGRGGSDGSAPARAAWCCCRSAGSRSRPGGCTAPTPRSTAAKCCAWSTTPRCWRPSASAWWPMACTS